MKLYKNDLNYIEYNLTLMLSNDFVEAIINALVDLTEYPTENRKQIQYYKRILKTLLCLKFGYEKLFVTNMKEVYPNNYPLVNDVSVNGFEQFEVALDISQRPFAIGIVLNVFEGVYNGETEPKTQEIRMDTNGVMCDEYVRKINLSEFVSRLDFTNDFHIRLLKGLLVDNDKYIAVAVNNDYLVQLSKPCTYSKAMQFKGSQASRERFKIVGVNEFNSYNKKII